MIYVCIARKSKNEVFFLKTYRNKSVSLGPTRLGIHNQLNGIDLAKWFKYTPQHVLGDVKVQRSHIQSHGSCVALRLECGGSILETILFSLRMLYHDRHSKQPLAR